MVTMPEVKSPFKTIETVTDTGKMVEEDGTETTSLRPMGSHDGMLRAGTQDKGWSP